MPRRGTVRMKPSCSSSDSASRIGVRLTPSAVGQLALIEPQFLLRIIDIRVGDGGLQQGIGLIAQAGCVERRQCQRRGGGCSLNQRHYGIH